MNPDLFRKLQNEEPLSIQEMIELELALEQQDSDGLDQLTLAGEDKIPSLAWRSSLNEKLLEQQHVPKEKVRYWLSGAAAAAVIAAVAFFVWPSQTSNLPQIDQKDPIVQSKDPSIGSMIVDGHVLDNVNMAAGISVPEDPLASDYDWKTLETSN